MIAWLEKQDEQKPDNKVEPKFEIGDCAVENEPNNYARFIHILEIINVQGKDRYRISRDIHNDEDIVDFDFAEKYYHKFDIKDAKDGDVLCLGGVIAIFKKYIGQEKCICYCSFCNNGGFEIPIENGEDNVYGCTNTTPATQEQRDLLFQKMKGEGYEWNAEKKELNKIEHTVEIPFGAKDSELQEATYHIPEGYHAEINGNEVVIKKGKNKSTWKPTEKQINAIRLARSFVTDDFGNNPTLSEVLKELEEQLKTL